MLSDSPACFSCSVNCELPEKTTAFVSALSIYSSAVLGSAGTSGMWLVTLQILSS